jgi:hypothetical protein
VQRLALRTPTVRALPASANHAQPSRDPDNTAFFRRRSWGLSAWEGELPRVNRPRPTLTVSGRPHHFGIENQVRKLEAAQAEERHRADRRELDTSTRVGPANQLLQQLSGSAAVFEDSR